MEESMGDGDGNEKKAVGKPREQLLREQKDLL